MAKKKLYDVGAFTENVTNLNSVTSATNGDSVDTRFYVYKTIFVEVTSNTGAVTLNIEGSYDGSTWFNVDSTTYTATNTNDSFSTDSYFPFMRTTTTSQTTSIVKTTITGRS